MLTVGSLFTGIGGLDLGLERAGMTVAWQAEIDPFCCRLLEKRWPGTPNLGDVTTIDWKDVSNVDILCGGYPCQPFSSAGKRQGENDSRHLWPYVRDAISVLRPRWAVLENVAGHLSLGFGRVLGDLAEIGYDAEWDCIPAAAVGAPHRRDRVFILAYPTGTERGSEKLAFVVAPQRTAESGECGSRSGGHWAVEPGMGRVAYGIPDRMDRVRVLGNSVVPQIAEHIGNMIMEAERGSK